LPALICLFILMTHVNRLLGVSFANLLSKHAVHFDAISRLFLLDLRRHHLESPTGSWRGSPGFFVSTRRAVARAAAYRRIYGGGVWRALRS
jgi:hypothetical protein